MRRPVVLRNDKPRMQCDREFLKSLPKLIQYIQKLIIECDVKMVHTYTSYTS